MITNDLLRVLEETSRTIRTYKKSNVISPGLRGQEIKAFHSHVEKNEFRRVTASLTREIRSLGPAGNVCKRCGGSGREPRR